MKTKILQRNASGLALAILVVACEHPVASAPLEAPRALTPVPVATGSAYEPRPKGTPWSSEAPPLSVAEMLGNPVVMTAGARCATFRRLPVLRYRVNTLVIDACLEIPSDTTIQILDRASLVIVATNGLLLGRNVRFAGTGVRGRRGARAQFASLPLEGATDAEIQALCLERGNQCACPSGDGALAVLRGRSGEAGAAAGSLRLVVNELISPSKLAGFAVDVSGGIGGPPGESGTQRCARGGVSCSSPACSDGASAGPSGLDGKVIVSLGGANAASSLARIRAAVTPAAAGIVEIAEQPALAEQAARLGDEALQMGWERRAGEVH